MGVKALKHKVTLRLGKQILRAQKSSPTILFGVGVVGVVTTVVLASRATLKLDEVLGDAEKKNQQIDDAKQVARDKYTDEDAHHDGILVKTQTAFKIVRLYTPAFVVGTVTIAAFTGQHVILKRRNLALSAAYAAVDQGFREYRKRVVDEFGHQKDREYRFGTVDVEQAVDTDDGVAVKTVKGVKAAGPNGYSMYAKVFDRGNRCWQATPGYNSSFLKSQEMYANDLLTAQGSVTLNDVYDMLGFERTRAGQVVGWVKGYGDDYVSFGIAEHYEGMRFVKGAEKDVILDFNVHGEILDLAFSDSKG
jgi:hypothetical protein